jgi:hypothetical protein
MTSRLMLSLGAIAAMWALPSAVAGQTVRVSGSTSVRYIELRPFILDSVPQVSTEGEGLLRQLPDGRVVRCLPGEEFCRDTRPGSVVSTVPVIQDLDISAWGFGEGVHMFAQLRGRSAWGEHGGLWPRSEDALEVMAAYVEVERRRFRARAGRQWRVSGLGFYNFDGVSVAAPATPRLTLELFGGRSLVRGLNESRGGGALEAIEALAPADGGIIGGVQARYRDGTRLAVGASYQVDVRSDRRELYSELASVEGALRVGAGSIEGAVEADVASGMLNEARLHLRSAPLGRFVLFGELRHYRPYFELWTIWGAFSPLGYNQGRAGVTWADSRGRLVVRGEATYRQYDQAGRGETLDDFRYDGRGLAASVSWSPRREWRVDGGYRVESGFGAARRDGSVGAVRHFGERGSLGINGVVFQRLYEFRLDEGTVAGIGAEGAFALSDRARVMLSAAAYRHMSGGPQPVFDWNQRRASVRFQWTLGGEPELLPGSTLAGGR